MVFINKNVVQGYDLIGDVHGCALALGRLLQKMGYEHKNGCYRHPQRKVIFVGDIVDRGPRIRESLHIVKDMVDQGQAEIVLGNHEYNSLGYCTKGPDKSRRPFIREHTARNHRLIRETLEQFEEYPDEWKGFLEWFHEIPLFIEKDHFRVVHACWDSDAIDKLKQQSPNHNITKEMLFETIDPESFSARVIDKLTRGTALHLPNGESILGKDGFVRHMFRTKFWAENPDNYDDVVFQPDPLPAEMANRKLSAIEKQKLLYYPADELPVFVGHYWMSGEPEAIAPNIGCLDYSAVKYGKLVAYRMDDEPLLLNDKFVWVDVVKP